MAIQKSLAMHRQHAAKLQQHERQYMEKAVRAKNAGDKVNFRRLCAMVAQTTNERRAVESQLLYFETMLQTRDKARLFNDFAKGMKAMARSVNDAFQGLDTSTVLKDIETALAQTGEMETAMNMVLDRISMAQEGTAVPEGGLAAEDVERILSHKADAENESADREIEAGLNAIRNELLKD